MLSVTLAAPKTLADAGTVTGVVAGAPSRVEGAPALAPHAPSPAPIVPVERPGVTIKAVLGPTNTGKTHLAIERMCGHSSGAIGFPLRLLAREV